MLRRTCSICESATRYLRYSVKSTAIASNNFSDVIESHRFWFPVLISEYALHFKYVRNDFMHAIEHVQEH